LRERLARRAVLLEERCFLDILASWFGFSFGCLKKKKDAGKILIESCSILSYNGFGNQRKENNMSTNIKKCPMCAEEIPSGSAACPFCGTDLTAAPVAGPAAGPAPAAPVPAPPPPVPPAPAAPARVIEVFEQKGEDPGVRFLASWFDQIIIGLIFAPVVLLAAVLFLGSIEDLAEFGARHITFYAVLLLVLFLLWALYFSIQEGIFGATLGKVLGVWPARLQVIRKDGGKIGFGKALLRAVIGFFETNLIGAIVIWSTGLRQRLGDLAAGTLVVDATKIRRAEFGPSSVIIEFLDGTRKEMVQMTKAVITKWLGVPQWMTVRGLDPQGRKVKFGARVTKGVTVFGAESKVGQLRLALEAAFHFPFRETTEWWRIALMIGILLLGALCFLGAMAIPSLPDPGRWFTP
jgi:uncharacterized RDD family membrane protein YckC